MDDLVAADHATAVEIAKEPLREEAMRVAVEHLINLRLDDDEVIALASDIMCRTRKGLPVYRLPASYPLEFRPGREKATVMDVLIDPNRYLGRDLNDPLEPDYPSGYCARILRGNRSFSDGSLFIHSYAHGECYYLLAPEVGQDLMAAALEAAEANAGEMANAQELIDHD
jgi:hypothetical protein